MRASRASSLVWESQSPAHPGPPSPLPEGSARGRKNTGSSSSIKDRNAPASVFNPLIRCSFEHQTAHGDNRTGISDRKGGWKFEHKSVIMHHDGAEDPSTCSWQRPSLLTRPCEGESSVGSCLFPLNVLWFFFSFLCLSLALFLPSFVLFFLEDVEFEFDIVAEGFLHILNPFINGFYSPLYLFIYC